MCLKVLPALICHFLMALSVSGQSSQDMLDLGRAQYQLLQDRGDLPQYGSCWKEAVNHVHEGCHALSEESQSDIALHLTNCFLTMSGHETYQCERDKKPNLRGICINSMSDRAFNVYTEFYTHTQNICWFLRGQIWHETIAENTLKVGKQLEVSAKNQENILEYQKQSLELQEKLLKYGLVLEKIMEDFYISTQRHQEVLSVMSNTLGGLQSWLLGEISWFDTLTFYVTASLLVLFFTTSKRTAGARLINVSLLILNAVLERIICHWVSADLIQYSVKDVQINYNFYVWICRYVCLILCLAVLLLKAYSYKDYVVENNVLLQNVYSLILNMSESFNRANTSISDNSLNETDCNTPIRGYSPHAANCNLTKVQTISSSSYDLNVRSNVCDKFDSPSFPVKQGDPNTSFETCKENVPLKFKIISSRRKLTPSVELQNIVRYNLRSRNGTPDSSV